MISHQMKVSLLIAPSSCLSVTQVHVGYDAKVLEEKSSEGK